MTQTDIQAHWLSPWFSTADWPYSESMETASVLFGMAIFLPVVLIDCILRADVQKSTVLRLGCWTSLAATDDVLLSAKDACGDAILPTTVLSASIKDKTKRVQMCFASHTIPWHGLYRSLYHIVCDVKHISTHISSWSFLEHVSVIVSFWIGSMPVNTKENKWHSMITWLWTGLAVGSMISVAHVATAHFLFSSHSPTSWLASPILKLHRGQLL